MNSKISMSWSLAAMVPFAGQAIGQGQHDQGTIDRQRTVLTAHAANGWLSNHADSRFWFWNILSFDQAYDPQDDRYDNSMRWVHASVNKAPGYLIDNANGGPHTARINALASQIVNKTIALWNEDITNTGSYALFIQHWGLASNLLRHHDDELSPVARQNGAVYIWESHPNPNNSGTSANTATPWRENSVSDANAIFQLLVSEIISLIDAHNTSNNDTVPYPSRFFLDDENGYFKGTGPDVLAVYHSLLQDNRSGGVQAETLYGDLTNWTSSPSPVLDDIFNAVGFNTGYIPWYSYPHVPHSLNDQHQFSDYTMHRSLLQAVQDGATEAAIEQTVHAAWPGCLWANYNTSTWYTWDYPAFSRGDRGAPRPGFGGAYGWSMFARNGSADMQSPVLYPVHPFHSLEYERDGSSNETLEERMRAALMFNRQQLDHAIFSFDDLPQAPRHIVPWVPTASTVMSIPGGATSVPKWHTRDVLALCKSKGVNETILWGDTHGGNTTQSKDQWEQSNDAISQVWSYDLREIYIPSLLDSLNAAQLDQARFGEEHAYDLDPVVTFSGGTVSTATFEVDFDVDQALNTVGEEYTLMLEVLDGGGPWSGAPVSVSVYNFQAGSLGAWEDISTLSGTHETLHTTSSRHVEFDDTDSDGFYEDWHYESDDDSIVSDVSDRKSIHKWTFQLPSDPVERREYLHAIDLKMRFQIEIENTALIPVGGSADPLRIDLVQLYESETVNDNVQPGSTGFVIGDLDYDGDLDSGDMYLWYQNYVSNPGVVQLDLNDDGVVDTADLLLIYNLINS
ncbi:MAG: hypothetical protein ED559_08990 [Phycisphaera sp.]|nr:MAG: hypothetical protein ED559_08990 [Phycisphaera sp.]